MLHHNFHVCRPFEIIEWITCIYCLIAFYAIKSLSILLNLNVLQSRSNIHQENYYLPVLQLRSNTAYKIYIITINIQCISVVIITQMMSHGTYAFTREVWIDNFVNFFCRNLTFYYPKPFVHLTLYANQRYATTKRRRTFYWQSFIINLIISSCNIVRPFIKIWNPLDI